jgi:hypothetical protein
MRLHSLLDLDLPPLVDAERSLAELAAQRSRRLVGALGLAGLAVAAAAVLPDLRLPLVAGAVAALITAGVAMSRRRALLALLVQARDAYRLEAVAEAGTRFATRARRERLAAWLRRIVHAAESSEHQAAYTATALEARVLARKARLLAVAAALEDREHELHPAGVAIVHRLLTRPSVSPLFNPGLEEQVLDDTLHRVEAAR